MELLIDKGILSEELYRTILGFRYNSGFSVHHEVLIKAGNRQGLEKLARYTLRNPVALEKILIRENGAVYYRAKAVNPNFHLH